MLRLKCEQLPPSPTTVSRRHLNNRVPSDTTGIGIVDNTARTPSPILCDFSYSSDSDSTLDNFASPRSPTAPKQHVKLWKKGTPIPSKCMLDSFASDVEASLPEHCTMDVLTDEGSESCAESTTRVSQMTAEINSEASEEIPFDTASFNFSESSIETVVASIPTPPTTAFPPVEGLTKRKKETPARKLQKHRLSCSLKSCSNNLLLSCIAILFTGFVDGSSPSLSECKDWAVELGGTVFDQASVFELKELLNASPNSLSDKRRKLTRDSFRRSATARGFKYTIVVSPEEKRTAKYLLSIARGVPVVTPNWLLECRKKGEFPPVGYPGMFLQAGCLTNSSNLVSIANTSFPSPSPKRVFESWKLMIVGKHEFTTNWSVVASEAGATIVSSPSALKGGENGAVICEHRSRLPVRMFNSCRRLRIAILNIKWVADSIINQEVVPKDPLYEG